MPPEMPAGFGTYDIANHLLLIANILSEKGDAKGAKQYAEQARQLYTKGQTLVGIIGADQMLARLARDANDLRSAEFFAQEAVALSAAKYRSGIRTSKFILAQVRLKQNRPAEAMTLLKEAEAGEKDVSPGNRVALLILRGEVLQAQGKTSDALAAYKEAVALHEKARTLTPSEEQFADLKQNRRVYERIVDLLIETKHNDEAFGYLTRARSREVRDTLRLSSIKAPQDRALQGLIDRAADLEFRLRASEGRLQNQRAKPGREQATGVFARLEKEVASLRAEYDAATRQITQANENFKDIVAPDPADLGSAPLNLPPGVALVQYTPLGERLYVFLVTKQGVKVYRAPVTPQTVWKRIDEFRALMNQANGEMRGGKNLAIANWMSDEAPVAKLRENLTSLYAALIAPIEPHIAEADTVLFVPTHRLSYLPLHALAKKQGNTLRFLIEDKRIGYLTKATTRGMEQPRDASRPGTGMMAVANPAGADLLGSEADAEAAAAVISGAEVRSGAQATKRFVLDPANLDKRFWFFGAHGKIVAGNPLQSCIKLAPSGASDDGELTAGEIIGLRLRKVDLVFLSVCESAIGETNPSGVEVTSLANAFSIASGGKTEVVAGLWRISDSVPTKKMVAGFFERIARGEGKAEAMRQAQIAVMRDPQHNHPYYWAPLLLMGDWR